MNWDKDKNIERMMSMYGFQWTWNEKLPIKNIRIKDSTHNNARFNEAIKDSKKLEYASRMKSGDSFPAPVIGGTDLSPKFKNLILAGNHRLHAAKYNGEEFIKAYIVNKGNDMTIEKFVRIDNTKHGLSISDEDKKRQCAELYLEYMAHGDPKPLREIVIEFFTENRVDSILPAVESLKIAMIVDKMLMEKGRDASKLCDNHKVSLYRYRNNTKIFLAVVDAIISNRLTVEQTTEMNKSINDNSTNEQTQLDAIKKYESSIIVTTREISPHKKYSNMLAQLHNFIDTHHSIAAICGDNVNLKKKLCSDTLKLGKELKEFKNATK